MSLLLYPLKNYSTQNGYYISKDNWDEPGYAMHFHDSIEITLLVQGTGSQIVNGSTYAMPTYTMSIMTLKDCHKFDDFSSDNLLYNLMILPSVLPESVLKKLDNLSSDKICVLPENIGKTVVSIMDALAYSQSVNHNYSPTFVASLCQNLIDIFLHHYTLQPSSENGYNESILQTALIYINAHFASAITLGEIAAHAKCNATYLSELFHKKMDMTIKQYITVMRIKQAKRLLISSDNSIMSICFESGFSSLASFNRNFLAVENISPSAYRKAYNLKNAPKKMQ